MVASTRCGGGGAIGICVAPSAFFKQKGAPNARRGLALYYGLLGREAPPVKPYRFDETRIPMEAPLPERVDGSVAVQFTVNGSQAFTLRLETVVE